MGELVTLQVKLRAFVRREKKGVWLAVCPSIGVMSQGADADDAKRCLREAVEAWFESCIERGVLEQALREVNFVPLPHEESPPADREVVTVKSEFVPDDDVLGDAFPIHIAIPAYQAALFL
jgi:predicted RNase H-like HicB family nuclease